ncbi:calcium-binding protein [Ciceribacter sp. L1K23]|uniref:calcium-binding protein n=1 Tax=Ciceribacter sp. L1K23 TaxID=2820276 RepID=UPI001B82AED8|nr:calcium-binding protein [Ciceribacter sp. L1K23]MBR0556593.1 calcium-binding protein [Ciceribacter sp. L1K23]
MALQIITTNSVGTGVRANLGTSDSAIVMAGVTLGSNGTSIGDSAIGGTGSYHVVELYGNAVGVYAGISLGDSQTNDYWQRVNVHETALVYGSYTGIVLSGTSSKVVNEGMVVGQTIGITFGGEGGSTSSTLINAGKIRSDGVGIYRANDSTEKLVIANSGVIEADFALWGNNTTAIEEITNTGRIIGHLDFSYGNDLYDGRSGTIAGEVYGGGGNDRLYGGAGGETFYGGADNDTLRGYAGNDILDGGSGADRMEGGTGHDRFYVDDAGDVVVELSGQGTDTVEARISYTLGANVENLVLKTVISSAPRTLASAGIDGTGNALANVITGSIIANTLKGLDGNDTLKGMEGNDKLYGGAGADKLYGGTGADRFVFTALADSTVSSSARDMIYDFSQSQGDRVDLSAIDASTRSSGNQAFSFIGEKSYSGKAGELRTVHSGGDTYVYGDVNGDKKSDFAIRIDANIDLVKGDFIL